MTHTIRGITVAAILAAIAACSDGGGDLIGPNPEPEVERFWDMTVTLRYVKASPTRTCDGTTLFGNVNPGEYQYRIEGEFKATKPSYQSHLYNNVLGTSYELSPGEIRNFADQKWTFTGMTAGDAAALALRSTEWDGLDRDDYMANRRDSKTIRPSELRPIGGTATGQELMVGTDVCGLILVYDVTVTTYTQNLD